jgi:putative transposase
MDEARHGPTWLQRPEIAELVVDAMLTGAGKLQHFELHAYVVMPNHVHILVSPIVAPRKFMQSIKGFTARQANLILHQTGNAFWQSESYDHWVRSDDEFNRIRAYIENNPVRAGLVAHAEDYRWSSAYVERPSGCHAGL